MVVTVGDEQAEAVEYQRDDDQSQLRATVRRLALQRFTRGVRVDDEEEINQAKDLEEHECVLLSAFFSAIRLLDRFQRRLRAAFELV